MLSDNFTAIDRLRENREQSALVNLQNSNAARDMAEIEARTFADHLKSQSDTQSQRETGLYQGTVGNTLQPDDLDLVNAQIDRERREIQILATHSSSLAEKAEKAKSSAELARQNHARLLRARKKWEKLCENQTEKNAVEELYREEMTFDDVKPSRSQF